MKSAPVFHPARQTIFAVLASSPKASEPFRAWLAGMFDTRFGSAKALLDSVIPALRQAHSTDTAVDLLRGAVAEGWVTRCPNEDRGTILGAMRRGGYAVQPELCYGYEPVLASAEARLFLGGQYLWTPIAGNHASRQPSAALCACGHPLSRHAGRDDHSLVCYEHPCRCEAFAGQEMPDATTISRTIEATHAKPERTLPRILTPYYQRGSVTLYCGDAREIVPAFRRRGIVLCDPPYSATVHENAVSAGRRRTPLLDGNGRVSPCAVARKVDLGFGALTPEFRRFCAEQAARLASRWALFFCDAEGLGGWKHDLTAAGIPYRTHAVWRKMNGTPKFQGNECAVPDETIALAGEDPEEAIAGGHIACAHRAPGDDTPARWWNRGGRLGFYEVPVSKRSHGEDDRINTTQKPEKLIEQLILDWTAPGELIYDWTAGGCTTGVVAARLGHPVVLVERREAQCEAAAKRLDKLFEREDVESSARLRTLNYLDALKAKHARREKRLAGDKRLTIPTEARAA